MSTRRERKHDWDQLVESARFKTGQDLACAYGSHLFRYQAHNSHLHLHVCTNCDASYFQNGEGPCAGCIDPNQKDTP